MHRVYTKFSSPMQRIFKISLRQYNWPIRCLLKKTTVSLEGAHAWGIRSLTSSFLGSNYLGIKIGISGLEMT